jgi:DNA-binding winged helix-turn-helix (wHTH) protein
MPRYHFDGFEFDSWTGEIVKDGRCVRLRPQPARVLEHLLVHQGELVSREELRRAIWPDGTYVHFDQGLNSCIKQIRAALAGGYIETLVKRGFRFVQRTWPATGEPRTAGRALPPRCPDSTTRPEPPAQAPTRGD